MKRYAILIAAVLVSAVSCTAPRLVSNLPTLQEEWIGRTHSDIVRAFGAPSRECSDGADGYILIYESFRTDYDTWMDGSIKSSSEHRDFKEFYVGADGVCYDVRSNDLRQDGRSFSLFYTMSAIALASPLILFAIAR